MIEKSIDYNNNDFSKHLKGLGLSEKEIKYILGETKRKKFNGGGGGGDGGGGDGGGSSGGDGSSSGDSSGDGEGDSGPGGSDDGSSSGVGSGEGESTGDANDQGGTEGPSGPGVGAEGGFGIGPDAAAEAAQSVTADDVSAQAQADQEDAATAAAAAAAAEAEESGLSKAMTAVKNQVQKAIDNPVQTAIGIMNPALGFAFGLVKDAYSNYSRGVTGPSDDTQEQSSVQSGPAPSPSGGDGGITTLVPTYAPLVNQSTGDPLLDSLIARYRMNPASFGII